MTVNVLSTPLHSIQAGSHLLPSKQTLLNWARKVEQATYSLDLMLTAVHMTSLVGRALIARYAINLILGALGASFVIPLNIFILTLGATYAGCALALVAHLAANRVILTLSDGPA